MIIYDLLRNFNSNVEETCVGVYPVEYVVMNMGR